MQQSDFPFEIVLGDDESTDGTREICIEYAKKYPAIIRIFLRRRKDVIYINGNATGRFNMIESLKAAKGRFVAFCEGDDYWTDPLKLQKQVNFLEKNKNCCLVFNKFNQLENSKFQPLHEFSGPFNFLEFIKKNSKSMPLHTGSALFLNNKSTIEFFVKSFLSIPTGDYALFSSILTTGDGYCLKDNMSVRRIHSDGVSRKFDWHTWYQIRIPVLEILINEKLVPEKFLVETKDFLRRAKYNLFNRYVRKGHLINAVLLGYRTLLPLVFRNFRKGSITMIK